MSRFVRPLLNVVIAGGLLLAVWPLGQSVYGLWSQHELALQWQQEQQAPHHKPAPGAKARGAKVGGAKTRGHKGTPVQGRGRMKAPHAPQVALASASQDSPVMAVPTTAKIKPWALTKLSIPDIGLETFIVQGWDEGALRRGPGHLPQSSPAGQGNCVVAGHRNIYGSPFYRLDELMPGTTITLSNREGTFHYIVDSVFPTPDTNVQILGTPPANEAPRLTILTCTIPHTNNRIVVQALLSAT